VLFFAMAAKAKNKPQETTTFRDGDREIDFVLAFDAIRNIEPEHRETFEKHLIEQGITRLIHSLIHMAAGCQV